jgi:periplasmic protein TonB
MKVLTKVSLLFSLVLMALLGYTQPPKQVTLTYLYLNVDKIPKFNGGSRGLGSFLSRNIKYPDKAMEAQGTVLISFVVLKNGIISNIVVERSFSKAFDDEAKRVISLMPKWVPGELNGKKVNVKLYFPFDFSLH